MKYLFSLLFILTACNSGPSPKLEMLEAKKQQVINICQSCHIQGERLGAPRLEGLEAWYMEEQVEAFHAGSRGSDKNNLQAHQMFEAMKLIDEDDAIEAAEWFAGQKRPSFLQAQQGDAQNGAKLYKDNCYKCHSSGMGKLMSRSPEVAGMESWYLLAQLRKYKKGLRGVHEDDGHGQKMRQAVIDMDDKDFLDLVAYLSAK